MKFWLLIPLLVSCLAVAEEEQGDTLGKWDAAEPSPELEENLNALEEETPLDPNEPPVNWVDASHAVVTNQTQALTEWMDAFFGDPNYNLEQAESQLRLEFIEDWDQDQGNDFKVRVRGKLQLPKVSRRLSLVFRGEEGDDLTEEERRDEDSIGLQLKVRDRKRSRFDLTLGWASGSLRPGVRFRNEGEISADTTYRYIQRLQYEDGENFFTTGNVDINHILDDDNILRWSNRAKWGDHTDGVEWRTRLTLRGRRLMDTSRPLALSYYGTINGVTRPDAFVKNYRLGAIWRRQVYRDYLFLEVEPAINYRRLRLEEDREFALGFVVRLEFALERDLRRARRRDRTVEEE